ncbi:hypothetical protein C8R43DRAFT_869173, partial [Mycena crocata]
MSSSSTAPTVIAVPGKQPTLTPGQLTPSILADYERACRNYFNAKDIAAEKQVAVVMGGLQDVHIVDWLTPEDEVARVSKLKFKDFMAEIRARFLDADWESKTRTELLRCRMRADETFLDYHTRIVKIHSLLNGTASQLDPTRLQNTIEAGLVPDLLRRLSKSSAAKAATTLLTWIAAVKDLDEDRQNDIATIQAQLDLQRKSEKRKAETDGGNKHKKTTHDASHASAPLSSGSSSNRRNCPPLTDTEKSLLRAHRGCLKCRIPYVDHISKNCPTGFPNPDTCVPITESICLAAKNGNTAPAAAPTAPAAKPPAVAVVTTDDEFEVSLPTPPSHRAEHLFWECLVDGPAALSSLLIRALIDHGAHLALIDDALVTKLGLRRRKLREPEPISLAMSDESSEPQYLTEYVKLRLVSKDQAWVSNTVRFVVAPRLCAPLILGLPWLARNKIVVDHDARTVIDKRCKFDLLNPPEPSGPPKRKLKLLKEVDSVAAVRERIEVLAHWDELQERAAALRKEYNCLFEPMPHVNDLPTDVLCEIKIKEADMTFKTRTYQSPRKYQEAWR